MLSSLAGALLFWSGPIDPQFVQQVGAALAGQPVRALVLESHGGSLESALAAIKLIQSRRLTTYVAAGSYCESACTLVFEAGAERIAASGARFLYHVPVDLAGFAAYRKHCLPPAPTETPQCNAAFEKLRERDWRLTDQLLAVNDRLRAHAINFVIRNASPTEPWGVRGNLTELAPVTMTGRELAHLGIVDRLEETIAPMPVVGAAS